MTLDEAIKICEEDAEKIGGNPQSDRHAERCRQLAEWLKELKDLRILIGGEDNYLTEPTEQADVQPIRRGHWIEKVSYSGWGVSIYTCSECENAETIPSKFCPNCGAELREVENG